jgi:hypothetical protein
VQSVVAERYTKVLAAHRKKVKALEMKIVEKFFDPEVQQVYAEQPKLAKCMSLTAWSISWHRPDADKDMSARIAACSKALSASKDDDGTFRLTDGLDRGVVKGREFVLNRHQFLRGQDQRASPFKPGGYNTYARVGPSGEHVVYVQPKSVFKENTSYSASTIHVADSLWLQAVDLEVRLLEMYTETAVLAKDLIADFEQRKTVERFREDFPELAKHVPHIPEPVKALIVPASAVLAKLEAVPAE